VLGLFRVTNPLASNLRVLVRSGSVHRHSGSKRGACHHLDGYDQRSHVLSWAPPCDGRAERAGSRHPARHRHSRCTARRISEPPDSACFCCTRAHDRSRARARRRANGAPASHCREACGHFLRPGCVSCGHFEPRVRHIPRGLLRSHLPAERGLPCSRSGVHTGGGQRRDRRDWVSQRRTPKVLPRGQSRRGHCCAGRQPAGACAPGKHVLPVSRGVLGALVGVVVSVAFSADPLPISPAPKVHPLRISPLATSPRACRRIAGWWPLSRRAPWRRSSLVARA